MTFTTRKDRELPDLAAMPINLPTELHAEPIAVDAIHHEVLRRAPAWPLAQFVTEGFDGDCDLVLVAVKPGRGRFVANVLAQEIKVAEVPDTVGQPVSDPAAESDPVT